MSDGLNELLGRVVEDTLASLAFLFPVPQDERDNEKDQSDLQTWAAAVTFGGVYEGELVLVVQDGVLPHLIANMLGVDESDPQAFGDRQFDALKELANVLTGSFLKELPQVSERPVTITCPHVLGQNVSVGELTGAPPAATVRLDLVEGVVEVFLFLRQCPEGLDAMAAAVSGNSEGADRT